MFSLPFDPWTSYGILILSEAFIFLVMALEYRLRHPLKLRATIWVGPVLSIYILASVLLSILFAVSALSLGAFYDYGAFLAGALVGVLLGTLIGGRIPVTAHPDGSTWFHGGKNLVALLWALLLPRAVDQAVLLIPAIYQHGTVSSILDSSPVLGWLDRVSGSLVFIGVFVSIAWRSEVQKKKDQLDANLRARGR